MSEWYGDGSSHVYLSCASLHLWPNWPRLCRELYSDIRGRGLTQAPMISRTSAGLYYFSAKLAPERHSALASWITGWANVTGQVTLVCSIDYTV